MNQQIAIAAPDGVTPPKFSLFQAVVYKKRRGIITGLRYICSLEALAESMTDFGWEYVVSYYFGNPPEKVLTAPETDIALTESDLCPCD
jgi:hypothetical protein